jgi:hypothetical protein
MEADGTAAEIARLKAEIKRLKRVQSPRRHGFMRLFIRDLETNPHSQYRVHRYGLYYWLINFPAVTALFFLDPSVWLKWGLYVTLIYSIYANASTDYGAMSAAMAAYEDRYLPPIPGMPFVGGIGGSGGHGGSGGRGGKGAGNGKPGDPGETGDPGKPGEPGKPVPPGS